jgi:uncharacterized membrane protein YdjX (TVP38/TMEM64 family)
MAANKLALKPRHYAGLAILGAITLLGFAAPFLPPDLVSGLGPLLARAQAAPGSPLIAVLGYALLASLGVPQIVLITSIVVVFGPWAGFTYSWVGKMLACSIGFALGRRFGARLLAERAGPRLREFMRQLARRGFLASALIRLAPTVPSVLINIAAGATPIRFRDFKMALLAFGGHAALEAVRHNSAWAWIVLGAVLILWALLALLARRWMRGAKTPDA